MHLFHGSIAHQLLCASGLVSSGVVGWAGRTFLDLPGRNVALGHGRRKRGHVEALSSQRWLSSVECYTLLSAAVPCPVGEMRTSPCAMVAQLLGRSAGRHSTCRSERSHGDQLARGGDWRLRLAGCERADCRDVECWDRAKLSAKHRLSDVLTFLGSVYEYASASCPQQQSIVHVSCSSNACRSFLKLM
jgi:hypothetical protein